MLRLMLRIDKYTFLFQTIELYVNYVINTRDITDLSRTSNYFHLALPLDLEPLKVGWVGEDYRESVNIRLKLGLSELLRKGSK